MTCRISLVASRRPAKWLCILAVLALSLPWLGCDSVVPADSEFASENPGVGAQCQTVVGPPAAQAAYDIAAIIPLTQKDGSADARGKLRSQAMMLAIQELNQRQGVAGKPFRLRICDTRADWSSGGEEISKQLAAWLITEKKVAAILSGGSSDTLAIAALTIPAGRLLMAITATSTDLTSLADNGLVWRIAPSDVYQGVVLARMVSDTVASGPVALLAEQSPYGDGLSKVLKTQLGPSLKVFSFASNGQGLATAVDSAAALAPAAVVVVAAAPLAAQVANLRGDKPALAKAALFFSDTAHNDDFFKALAAGVTVEGARGTLSASPTSPAYDAFAARYQSFFGVDPAQSSYTAHAYDAVHCVALAHAWALRSGGPAVIDGASLAQGLQHLASGEHHPLDPSEITGMVASLLKGGDIDIDGASGALDFNQQTGEAPSQVADWAVIADKKFATFGFWSVKDKGGGQYELSFAKP